MKIVELAGTTASDGSLTLTATTPSIGYVEKIVNVFDDGANTTDLVVTNEDGAVSTAVMTVTDQTNADVTYMPRSLGNKTTDGSAFANVAVPIFVTGKMKIVIAQGGAAKNHRYIITITDGWK